MHTSKEAFNQQHFNRFHILPFNSSSKMGFIYIYIYIVHIRKNKGAMKIAYVFESPEPRNNPIKMQRYITSSNNGAYYPLSP